MDLWGEIALTQLRTPRSILREQAALLGGKTQHIVEASVQTRVSDDAFPRSGYLVKTQVFDMSLCHSFNLEVPALSYTYNLFVIYHGPWIYPVHVGSQGPRFETEQEFIEWLSAKLSSPETKRIVANLLAQF